MVGRAYVRGDRREGKERRDDRREEEREIGWEDVMDGGRRTKGNGQNQTRNG